MQAWRAGPICLSHHLYSSQEVQEDNCAAEVTLPYLAANINSTVVLLYLAKIKTGDGPTTQLHANYVHVWLHLHR